MPKAVFLDRDGVLTKTTLINGKSFAPRTLKDFKLFAYSARSIKQLKLAGFMVFVITNQPDVARKLISKPVLKKMHDKLKKKTDVDKIFSCIHLKDANCVCRKPKPGMILNIAKKHKINLNQSYMVGDRAIDVEAGQRANCRTIFINRNYREKAPNKQEATFVNLPQAVKYILNQEKINNA